MCLNGTCCKVRVTNELTPRKGVLLEKLIISNLINKFPTSYETQASFDMFIRAYHWRLSGNRPIQFLPSHTVLSFINPHVLQMVSLGHSSKIIYTFLVSFCVIMPHPL
jgi:hypothetical protein